MCLPAHTADVPDPDPVLQDSGRSNSPLHPVAPAGMLQLDPHLGLRFPLPMPCRRPRVAQLAGIDYFERVDWEAQFDQ
jgi:hypothetical protein